MKPRSIIAAALLLITGAAFAESNANIPERPEKLQFKPLAFTPPKAQDFRRTLSNGVPVYLAASKEVPLVTINFSFRGGGWIEPEGKWGVSGMAGSMLRRGGAGDKGAADLDEEFDFLAANCSTSATSATLNTLKSNLDQSFKLFMDVIKSPRFQQDRFDLLKKETIEDMKQRNDDAGTIARREGAALMWGRDTFEGRVTTQANIESLTVDDLKWWHKRVFHPGNLIIGVTGDFEESEMLSRLEKAMEGWAKGEPVPDPPEPKHTLNPGVYHIEKDIPQGKFAIMTRGMKRDDPDAVPVEIMNDILGGGGFTSRIVNRVRTEEGLAYSAGSAFSNRVYYPGTFQAFFQSKNATCALATKIIFEEFNKIRSEPVSAEELEVAKNSAIETFPRTFESKAGTVGLFISDEWTKRPADYWQTYRDKVKAVTAADVQRVAQKYLDPAKMAIFVVGKWSEVEKGDLNGRATMKEFFNGQVNHVPLRDPLTDQPLPEQPSVESKDKPQPTR